MPFESSITSFAVAFFAGLFFGFLGAIPPGPLNVSVIRKASTHDRTSALRLAFGGALIDAIICLFVGLGLGWILEKIVTNNVVRLGLPLLLTAYGVKILVHDRKRIRVEAAAQNGVDGPPTPRPKGRAGVSLLMGALQGAANPTVFVNWTLFISFLVSHDIFKPGPVSAPAFALGIGIGVFLWFVLLVELVDILRDHPAGDWLRSSTTLAGFVLIGFGAFFIWKTFADF